MPIWLRVLCLMLAVFSTNALANSARYEFKASGNADAVGRANSVSEKGAILNYDFAAELTLGLLLGEPVVSLRFKYDVLGGFVTLPLFEKDGDPYYTKQFGLLDSESQDLVRLYNAKMTFTLTTGNGQSVDLQVDAGYLKSAGQWSYNVAGSPNWNQLFKVSGSRGKGSGKARYLSAKDARNAWRSGLKLSAWEIDRMEIYLTKLHQKHAVSNEQGRLNAALSAVKTLEKEVTRRSGLTFKPSIDPLNKAATQALQDGATQTQVSEALQMAYERIEKLSNPPVLLVPKDQLGTQALAVGRVWSELSEAEARIATFFDPDKDRLLQLAQGGPPEIDDIPLSQPVGTEHPDYKSAKNKLNRILRWQEEEVSRRPYKEVRFEGGPKGTGHVFRDSIVGKWYYKNYRRVEDSNNVEFVDIQDVDRVTLERKCPRKNREPECAGLGGRDYRVRLRCRPDEKCVGFKSVKVKSRERRESKRSSMYFLYCSREDAEDLAKALVGFGNIFGRSIESVDDTASARCSHGGGSRSSQSSSSVSNRSGSGEQKAGTYYLAWQTDQSERRLESCAPFSSILGSGRQNALKCLKVKSSSVYLYDPCRSSGGSGEYYRVSDLVLIKLTGLKPSEFETLRKANNNTQVASTSGIQAMSEARKRIENSHRNKRDRQFFVGQDAGDFMSVFNRISSTHKALGCKWLNQVN